VSAREEILGRVRASLLDVHADAVPVARDYRQRGDQDPSILRARLRERLEEYGARVVDAGPGGIAAAIGELCRSLALRRVAIPPQLERAWLPEGPELLADEGLDPRALDRIDAALTGCAVAIAQTGTIVLDGGERCGRRALTLVPDHHICVVEQDQIVDLVPEGLARVAAVVRDRRAPITLVSGPSATSDIELSRVVGVHGPRHLHVVLAPPAAHATT
jgi:L-lactate dehydrogenase complex protein LldG